MADSAAIFANVARKSPATSGPDQSSLDSTARVAGVLYLVVVLTGVFNLMYLPSRLYVQGDAATTVAHIAASAGWFRLGIVAELVCNAAFLLLPLVLYRLLASTGRNAAVLMVAFVVVQVPMACLNVGHKFDVLSLLGNASYLHAFTTDQLIAQVMLALDAYRHGILATQIFWGLWLLPLGYLVFKCGFLPRVLGTALMLGGVGYLVDLFGSVLFPGYAQTLLSDVVTVPASFGEIGICLWLLIIGARAPAWSIGRRRSAA